MMQLNSAKYKAVAKKVNVVVIDDSEALIPYKTIEIGSLPELFKRPTKMEDIKYLSRLMKENVEAIIGKIPVQFLTKAEVELLIQVMLQFENGIAFMDLERGTFSQKYFLDYAICPIGHQP